jgi:outer membrane protein assembly factor BamB
MEEIMKAISWAKLKPVAAAAIAVTALTGAAGVGLDPFLSADSPEVAAAAQAPAAAAPENAPAREPGERTGQPTAPLPRAEDYQSFMLSIDPLPDGTFAGPWMLAGGFTQGVAVLDRTLVRGAKFHGWYPHLNLREGGLTLDGHAIKGKFTSYDSLNRIGTWTIEGTVEGVKASGSFSVKFVTPKTGEEKTHTLKFTGALASGGALSKSNAIAAGKDWPCWSGPYTNMTSVPSGQKLVDDLDHARLVWRSQQAIGLAQGNFSHPYYAQLFSQPTCGGGAAPIIGDGKVFISQWFPDGKEYDADHLKKLQDAVAQAGLKEPTEAMKLNVSKTCHDWYLCMDAASGQTLWIAEFPEDLGQYCSGGNMPDHKNGPMGNTPCYANGKLFGLGMSGYLRGMDAKTGKLLWKQKIAGTAPAGRGNCNCVMFIGAVVLAGDHGGTLHACDPETGAVLWKAPGNGVVDPQRWTHGGKEYAIVKVGTEFRCLDPRTGKELWKLGGNFHHDNFFGLCGDVMGLVQSSDDKGQAMTIAAYTLSPEKAEKTWEVPSTLPVDTRFGTLVTEKHVVMAGPLGQSKIRLLDRATGKEAAIVDATAHANFGHSQVADDRLFVQPDGVHGGIHLTMLGTTPETFKVMGKPWSPKIPHTTSYAVKPHTNPIVDGRMYFRGADGIYCYDLRKTPAMLKAEAALEGGKSTGGAAIGALLGLCGDDDPAVRRWTLELLKPRLAADGAADRQSKVLQVISRLSRDPDGSVRPAAVDAMTALGAAALEVLLANAADPSVEVRISALRGLGRLSDVQDARLDRALAAGLAERDAGVVAASLDAAKARAAAATVLAGPVAACVDSPDAKISEKAIETLLAISPPGQAPAKRPQRLVEALIGVLGSASGENAARAGAMICGLGQDEAIRIFNDILKGDNALKGVRACNGLASLGKPAVPSIPLIREAKTKWAGSRTFVQVADRAIATIEKAQ